MTIVDDRRPVIVGVGVATQRRDDPSTAADVIELMTTAARTAADDAGAPRLLDALQWVAVPEGSANPGDPARSVASAFGPGAARAHTVRARVGVLQTTPLLRAAELIAAGKLDVALIVGGEAKYRDLRGAIAGVSLPPIACASATPDEVWTPDGALMSPVEVRAGVRAAVPMYAMIENARRFADGQSLEAHRRTVAELWARFSAVASGNPAAWHQQPMTADEIATAGPSNRPIALPYCKWHNSQWNVDQSAAIVLCSAAAARAHGVPTDRWVFPVAGAESDHITVVSERADVHRSPGFGIGGRRLLAHARTAMDEISRLDLYSCFPIAVRTQCLELGLDESRPLTVTGGMTFAGGPLNNYVFGAVVRMVQLLRADERGLGLNTAISGLITKQGMVLLSPTPPAVPFRAIDCTAEVAAVPVRAVDAEPPAGEALVASYTVLSSAEGPRRGVVICDLADGRRAVASSIDDGTVTTMSTIECCGRVAMLDGAGGFSLPA